MKIYTSTMSDAQIAEALSRNIGCLISASPHRMPGKGLRKLPHCALDNGAFTCWQKGYPFQSDIFLKTISRCYQNGITLDWIAIPDMVASGTRSLDFSRSWIATGAPLATAQRLALVVQDGMKPCDIDSELLGRVVCIFVGGSVDWKWESASMWVSFAHRNEKICHIGRVGKVELLHKAYKLGADSVDSSSLVRNASWHVVDDFNEQIRLLS